MTTTSKDSSGEGRVLRIALHELQAGQPVLYRQRSICWPVQVQPRVGPRLPERVERHRRHNDLLAPPLAGEVHLTGRLRW